MKIQVLPLKVLVTRQVINKRMDYSNYLNGTAKEELDRLDKLAGDFKFGSSKLRIDQGKGIQSDDWQDLKKKMPRGAVSYLEGIEGKAEFSIVEQMKNGLRTWYIFDANGSEGDLMSEKLCVCPVWPEVPTCGLQDRRQYGFSYPASLADSRTRPVVCLSVSVHF